jgi:hypothetical protein
VHFFIRSTDANTEWNGCQLTAVMAALRIKKPPDLEMRKILFLEYIGICF